MSKHTRVIICEHRRPQNNETDSVKLFKDAAEIT